MKNLAAIRLITTLLLTVCMALFACKNTAKSKGDSTTENDNITEEEKISILIEVAVSDILIKLSDNSQDSSFLAAIADATVKQQADSADFVDLFYRAWQKSEGKGKLARIFAIYNLREHINWDTSDDEVLSVLYDEVDTVIGNTINILRTRIDRFHPINPDIQRLGNSSKIRVDAPKSVNAKQLLNILSQRGRLEFWETFNNVESDGRGMYERLVSVNKIISKLNNAKRPAAEGKDDTEENQERSHSLFSILIPSEYSGKPYFTVCIGKALGGDTAKVNIMLSLPQVQNLLPVATRFMWTAKPLESDGYYELIALKVYTRDGRAPLDGSVITHAEAVKEEYGWSVNFVMNKEGAKIWQRITADNVGRSIALVIDGKVYSYPIVQSEIRGGKCAISGNLTKNEAEDMAIMLMSGELPVPVRVLGEIINENPEDLFSVGEAIMSTLKNVKAKMNQYIR